MNYKIFLTQYPSFTEVKKKTNYKTLKINKQANK